MASPSSAALTAEERFSRTTSEYTSRDIRVLEGIQAIQLRPAMYIGSTATSGLLHLIWEALDNAVDEAVAGYGKNIAIHAHPDIFAVAGYGKNIWVSVDRDGWVTVRDEARGMPFDPMLYKGEYLPAA